MKNTSTLLLVLLCLLSGALPGFAQSVGDYRSVASGDWSLVGNWERWDGAAWITPAPSAPTSTDGSIQIQNGHTININATPVTADQIIINAGGTLSVTNVLTLEDGTGADIQVNGTLSLANTIQNGTGTPTIVVDNILNWTGGSLGSATTVSATGTLNISGANKTLVANVDHYGTANWSASQVAFNNSTFNNYGVFNATAATPFNSAAGSPLFHNHAAGIFNKSTNAGAVTSNIPFLNEGTINITSGALTSTSATGSFTNTGTVTLAAGTTLNINGTLASGNTIGAGTTFIGNGTVSIAGGVNINTTLSVPSAITLTLASNALVIAGSGSLAINGTANWHSGTLSLPTTVNSTGTLVLAVSNTKSLTGTTLTNNGTINWAGFNLGFNGGTLNNNATINAINNNAFTNSGGTNLLHNTATGIINKSTGVATTTINIPVDNEGTVNINTGTVSITGANASFQNRGAINFNNTTLVTSGSVTAGNIFTTGTTLSGTGNLTINTTTAINYAMVIPSTVTLTYNGNLQTLGGSGSLGVNGTMNWGLGTLTVLTTINAPGTLNLVTGNKILSTTLTNQGTVAWSLGDLNYNNGTFNNNGTLDITGSGNFTSAGTTNLFQNSGTVNKSSSSTTNMVSVPVTNAGTINVDAGLLAKTGSTTIGFTNTGNIDIDAGAIFSYSSGGVSGLLSLNTGTTVTGSGTFRLNANTAINLPLTFPSTLTVEIGGANPPITGTGSATVNGTLNWGAGITNVPLTIGAGGVMNSTAAKTIAAPFENNGTVNLTDPSTGNITLNNTTFTNNGVVNDNFSVAARSFVSAGGTNAFINSSTGVYTKTNAGFTTTFGGNIPVTNDGRFEGIGNIVFTNALPDNDGTISPAGTSTGIFGVTANAINGHSPTIAINIVDGSGPGTGHDRLDLSAATNLSLATLVVTEVPTAPGNPTSYTIMTAPGTNAFTGTFASQTLPAGYSLTIDNASSPSAVIVTKIGTLPLTWGSFSATPQGNRTQLKWSTFQEENTSHFEIEHSIDARTYTVIGKVNASGNTANEVFYSFVHTTPAAGVANFYRIKQVDLNGANTRSRVVVADFGNNAAVAVKATPNPFNDQLQVVVQQEDINVLMTGGNGVVLRQWKLQPGLHTLATDNLPKGVYYLGIYQKGKRIATQQVIKL